MADASPPTRRRSLLVPLVAIGLIVLVAVLALLVAFLVRPSPAASTAARPTPTPAASSGTPAPAAPSSSGGQAQQHQQYRAYVSTLVKGGTAVVADLFGLAGCRDGRPECAQRLNDASRQVNTLQENLAATPAPACLTTADEQLQDSLVFQEQGLDMAHDAILAQNRLRLMQGLLLTAAGVWRSGQAIVHGRQADC